MLCVSREGVKPGLVVVQETAYVHCNSLREFDVQVVDGLNHLHDVWVRVDSWVFDVLTRSSDEGEVLKASAFDDSGKWRTSSGIVTANLEWFTSTPVVVTALKARETEVFIQRVLNTAGIPNLQATIC